MSTPTTTSILETLYAASAGNLAPDAMKWIAESADDLARRMTADLKETVNGIGCLVANEPEDGGGAGNFQGQHDLPELLFGIAHSLDTIGGLMALGSRARDALACPEGPAEGHRLQAKLIVGRKGGGQMSPLNPSYIINELHNLRAMALTAHASMQVQEEVEPGSGDTVARVLAILADRAIDLANEIDNAALAAARQRDDPEMYRDFAEGESGASGPDSRHRQAVS